MTLIGNRYEILSKIDSIELNTLYKARDVYDNTKVLIKIIEHENNIHEDFVSNLIDESTNIDGIKSHYIMKILEVGVHCTEDTVLYYIVSEYCGGIGLDKIISGNYLHLEAIIGIATQILRSLEVAHAHNLYHGDLKPSNIIVDKWYNIKISDFGVTKANNGVNLRLDNNIRYLCPHQLNINYTDIESDFFALGIILYECIFKKLPFEKGATEKEMLKFIDKGVNWNEVKAVNGNEELINIIKKLLSRTNKYTNISDIIIDISKIMYDKADIEEEIIDEMEEKSGNGKIISPKKFLLGTAVIALISFMAAAYL